MSCTSFKSRNISLRKNSEVTSSNDAITPKSICENSFVRGLYNFADQLLYSLSTLEDDTECDSLMFERAMINRRNKRCVSCPSISNHLYKSLPSVNRRKTSDVNFSSLNLSDYANNLATSILIKVNNDF